MTETTRVTIVDIDISLMDYVKIWMNVLVASIPAVLLMAIGGFLLFFLIGGTVTNILR